MQPIGIRPTNDFAFKKTFGSPENKLALISLLNAILTLPVPIVDVTIENPYNLQDFQNDKLSILDIRAVDQRGAIYDVEMQLSTHSGLVKRIVFYGCEVYAGQLKAGTIIPNLSRSIRSACWRVNFGTTLPRCIMRFGWWIRIRGVCLRKL
jgi:predicted transposase/invertase (TIGR01784 family)